MYGVLSGSLDSYGQPEDDAVLVALAGDPLYVGVKLLEQEYRLDEVRLLAPVLAQQGGRDRTQLVAHAAELGSDARRALDVPQAEHQRGRPG